MSICFFKNSLVCLCMKKLDFVSHVIPKTKNKSVHLSGNVEKSIKLACNAKALFGMDNGIAIWTYEKEIVLCYNIKGTKALFKTLTIHSPIRPITDGDNMIYMSESKCVKQVNV